MDGTGQEPKIDRRHGLPRRCGCCVEYHSVCNLTAPGHFSGSLLSTSGATGKRTSCPSSPAEITISRGLPSAFDSAKFSPRTRSQGSVQLLRPNSTLKNRLEGLAGQTGRTVDDFAEALLRRIAEADVRFDRGVPAFPPRPGAPILTVKDVDGLERSAGALGRALGVRRSSARALARSPEDRTHGEPHHEKCRCRRRLTPPHPQRAHAVRPYTVHRLAGR
jgi:hypothetical protein